MDFFSLLILSATQKGLANHIVDLNEGDPSLRTEKTDKVQIVQSVVFPLSFLFLFLRSVLIVMLWMPRANRSIEVLVLLNSQSMYDLILTLVDGSSIMLWLVCVFWITILPIGGSAYLPKKEKKTMISMYYFLSSFHSVGS